MCPMCLQCVLIWPQTSWFVCVHVCMYVCVHGLWLRKSAITSVSLISFLGRLLSVPLFKGQVEYGGSLRDPFLLVPQRQVEYLRKQRENQHQSPSTYTHAPKEYMQHR